MREILRDQEARELLIDAPVRERYPLASLTSPANDRRRMGGRFVVEREVGRGGVGVVYRAWDLETERPVALKVIAADAGVAPEDEARLTREGNLLSSLDHPGIVKTVAYGVLEESGSPYVAMEWLEGEDV